MLKLTNTGDGEIALPIGGGVTLRPNGGTADVKAADWEALLASDEMARWLRDNGVITADKAKKAE